MTQKTLRCLTALLIFGLFAACAAPALAGRKKHPPAAPVNLNTATASQLEELPGIGPVTAKAILDFRAKSGPFHRAEDLLSIHGISRSKFEKLRRYVTVAPPNDRPEKSSLKPVD